MALSDIVLYVLVGAEGLAIFLLWRRLKGMEQKHQKVLTEMTINAKLSDAFSEAGGLHELAKHVFTHAKKRYNLRANTHNELIAEVREHPQIDQKVRELLVDFFENLVLLSYKKDSATEGEKEALKGKIKLLIAHLQAK